MKLWKAALTASMTALLIAGPALAQENDRQNRQRRGGQARQARQARDDGGLKVGQLAPTFKLSSLDGTQSFDLKKFRGEKPVVLFFGSYT